MLVKSLDSLDLSLGWQRVLWWAKERLEIPDRLPFAVLERVLDVPTLDESHDLRSPIIVFATKPSGAARPFVRLSPQDALLYQSLVDALAPTIESALPSRSTVLAYRQTLDVSKNNPFDGSPKWRDFSDAQISRFEDDSAGFALSIDITSFYLFVQIAELERVLLESGADGDLVRDLTGLLDTWQHLGVRGLPQGLPPSSPLGNVYLLRLDRLLQDEGVDFVRYVDDIVVFAESYSHARRIQHLVEGFLYDVRLSVTAQKLKIRRNTTALEDVRTARQRIDEQKRAFHEGIAIAIGQGYADEDDPPEPKEIDAMAVLAVYEELLEEIRSGTTPPNFRPTLREIYRDLESVGRPEAVPDIPELLRRYPDMTPPAMLYAAGVGSEDLDSVITVFNAVLEPDRFHHDYEYLHICRAALRLPPGSSADLAATFGAIAIDNERSPLVRARALLAWGALGAVDDLETADAFWRTAKWPWRAYGFVAIQDKDSDARNLRFEQWSRKDGFLQQLGDNIQGNRFGWTRI